VNSIFIPWVNCEFPGWYLRDAACEIAAFSKREEAQPLCVCAARLHVYTTPAFYRWRESDCRAVRFQTTNYTTTSTTVPTWNGFRYDSRSRPISFLASQKHVCKDESVILTKTFFCPHFDSKNGTLGDFLDDDCK